MPAPAEAPVVAPSPHGVPSGQLAHASGAQADEVQWFDVRTVPAVPWKNGGGSTRELACWPPGADTDAFGWRVSVARIGTAGPFSVYAGVDRYIMLLDGDGVALHSEKGELLHTLQQRWQPWGFAGECPLDSRLIGGPSTDFNLMLRRGQWQGDVQVRHEAHTAAGPGAGLCMVLQGQWAVLGDGLARVLEPGQGMWWPGPMRPHTLQPLQPVGTAGFSPFSAPFSPDVRPALVRVEVNRVNS